MATTDAPSLQPFEATPVAEIAPTITKLRDTFRSNKTKIIEYRLVQLRRLYWAIKDNQSLLCEALAKDLRKSYVECMTGEIDFSLQDCLSASNNLKQWAKEESFTDIPLQFRVLNTRIRKDPLGVALVIGAYNFPVNLSLGPLIGAISAGCTAVLKPSEGAPATAMVLTKIVSESLDPDAYAVVNGGIPQSTELLDQKWDKIFYTGGAQVGTLIATKAAQTLTPVTLELGGKNPAIITRHADLALATRRLMWSKCMNAGQVCLSHNYILVDRAVLSPFLVELKKCYDEMFPKGVRESPDYARIINTRHFHRIKKMMDDSGGKVVMGGQTDEEDLFIEPTVVQVDNVHDSTMVDEAFGPLSALMPYSTLEEAIVMVNEVDRTPLALYIFGKKEEQELVLNSCLSGGASMNDTIFHGVQVTVPFGGVGTSGMGSYRGRASFETFTHRRTVATTPSWIDKLLRVRYMPYQIHEYKKLAKTHPKPNFDRSGTLVRGSLGYWLKFVLGLGAGREDGVKGTPKEAVSGAPGPAGDVDAATGAVEEGTASKTTMPTTTKAVSHELSRATTEAGNGGEAHK